jgi:hypothetical protein
MDNIHEQRTQKSNGRGLPEQKEYLLEEGDEYAMKKDSYARLAGGGGGASQAGLQLQVVIQVQ